jgi:protein-S-isoprenylcysteine O-methyltransferase Ste14
VKPVAQRIPSLGDKGQGWVLLQAVVMAAIPIVGSLAPRWPEPFLVPLVVVGAVIVLAGWGLLAIGIRGLGDSFAVFPAPGKDAGLVTSGVYGRARHPIFGGWILMGLGFGLAGSAWSLALVPVLALVLYGKSVAEEQLLQQRYPQYEDYRARVPRRFFPRLRGG